MERIRIEAMDDGKSQRTNGLESPHDSLQLTVWGVTLIVSILSIVGSYFLLSTVACVLFNLVFNGLLFYHLFVHFRTVSIDPILEEDKPAERRDKQCRECQKRVERWDHHCFFLNTCIGKKNYWYFVQTVFSGFFVALFNTVTQVGFIIHYIVYGWRTEVELFPTELLALVVLAAGLSILIVFHSGHLYYLHAWVLYPLGNLTAPEFFKTAAISKSSSSSTGGTSIQSSKPSFENDKTRKFEKWHALRDFVAKTVSTDTDPQVMEEYMDYVLEKRRQTLRGRNGNSNSRRRRSRSRSRTRLMSAQNVQFKSHPLRS